MRAIKKYTTSLILIKMELKILKIGMIHFGLRTLELW